MTLSGTKEAADAGVRKGAYVVSKSIAGIPQALLLATGSEVQLAILAQAQLAKENISVAVVSLPSWNLFEKQSSEYRKTILPPTVKVRLAIEMGSSLGWERYVGDSGGVLAIDRFGASGTEEILLKQYGFTVENVVDKIKQLLKDAQ